MACGRGFDSPRLHQTPRPRVRCTRGFLVSASTRSLGQAQRLRLNHRALRECRRARVDAADEFGELGAIRQVGQRVDAAVPRLRCGTLASTSSSVDAAPLWKYGPPAKTPSNDGMLMPSTPLAPSVLS